MDKPIEIAHACGLAPVIPVLTIADASQARPLAEALVAGGLPVLEVTLRTEAALDAIARMSAVEGAVVGAGTLLRAGDAVAARAAGARFGVSPGASDTLLDACAGAELPLLPGAATASEIMRLRDRGHDIVKFFPAAANGGVPALRALQAPFPGLRFCPTGGITAAQAPDYLALDCVACIGASWVAPAELTAAGDWQEITRRAHQASAMRTGTGPRMD